MEGIGKKHVQKFDGAQNFFEVVQIFLDGADVQGAFYWTPCRRQKR